MEIERRLLKGDVMRFLRDFKNFYRDNSDDCFIYLVMIIIISVVATGIMSLGARTLGLYGGMIFSGFFVGIPLAFDFIRWSEMYGEKAREKAEGVSYVHFHSD